MIFTHQDFKTYNKKNNLTLFEFWQEILNWSDWLNFQYYEWINNDEK